MMKIAIYTRKSKYSDKSESIDSQIEYCKKSAKLHFPDINDYEIYVDEGFSGGNIDRPEFKRMIEDIKKSKNFKALICYKIDRISRSLTDFTTLQQKLEKKDIHILSASEGFDTSTPWGVAVLNILMIFAQLERNNVSERIKDTMLHYAKSGRWTGGTTPLGFESKSITYRDNFNQEKNMTVLSPIKKEIEIVEIIFNKYIELRSLNSVVTYLVQNDIKTRKNFQFSVSTVRNILINPVYVIADIDSFNFFKRNNCDIYNDEKAFNSEYGVIPYNREDKKKNIEKPINEWLIAIGKHKGIIDGKTWVMVQNILKENSQKSPRLGTAKYGVLSGLIKCNNCGSTMRIKGGRINASGVQDFYYVCSLKETSKRKKCDIKNISGLKAEQTIIETLYEYSKNIPFNSLIERNNIHITYSNNDTKKNLDKLNLEINKIKIAIDNLLDKLSQSSDENVDKIIFNKLSELNKEQVALEDKKAILELEHNKEKINNLNLLSLQEAFKNIKDFNTIEDIKQKRNIIKLLIEEIDWNGEKMIIRFNTDDSINFNKAMKQLDSHENMWTFHSRRQSGSTFCRFKIPTSC